MAKTYVSFFSGIGGIDLAFNNAGFENKFATDIDTNAEAVYNLNHENTLLLKDIFEINKDEVPDADVLVASFPFQPFRTKYNNIETEEDKNNEFLQEVSDTSANGNGGIAFLELYRIILAKQPEVVFLENPRNTISADEGKTFANILRLLEDAEYFVKYEVMNTKSFGNLPQNRERVYIVAFKNQDFYNAFEFPNIIKRFKTLHSVIEFDKKVNDKYYYTDDNFKYYDILKTGVISSDTVYQWRRAYVRENKSNLCPTLTNNMGIGGHNIPIILAKHGIRRITPRECFNLQGFPETFKFPKYMTDTHLYKQAGNTVSVTVVERIAKKILKTLEKK